MNDRFVALDVETAVGKRYSICQIGLAFFEDDKITKTITRYVQPPNNEYHYMNISIHKITPDKTINEPFFPDIWNEIYPLIKGQKLVAHNASFDKSCLNKALEYYEIETPNFDFDCTYKISGNKLNIACKEYKVPLEHHHDAACDAKACGLLYVKLKQDNAEMPAQAQKKSRPITKPTSTTINHLISDKLEGLRIIASGKLQNFSRDEIKQVIEDNGAKAVSSISGKTNYLIAGENIGPSKLEKAQNLNIPIISEKEFMAMIE